ncbi:MAG: penicillin acylase family protein [Rhodocyclaceae bacterium]|nr:penicillin acylase family protein [Rhodocyclaceae bacterium]
MALLNLVSDANSPWWDNPGTKAVETRTQTMKLVWHRTLEHLKEQYGNSLMEWAWGKTHTLTHIHPLSAQKPFDWILDVGPFSAPGAHETLNNLGSDIGPAPWAVTKGPSTRRIIDFADARGALGVNPVGQSGVWGDKHYQDQALPFIEGFYFPQHLSESAIKANTQSTLKLQPAR